MGIFRRGDQVKKAAISTLVPVTTQAGGAASPELESPITGQIIPTYQADSLGLGIDDAGNITVADGFSRNSLSDTIAAAAPMANYNDLVLYGDAAKLFNPEQSSPDNSKKTTDAGGDLTDWWDIAQSHFFTVQIYGSGSQGGTGIHYLDGTPISFASGEDVYKDYIPVKSMNFNYTSYENMSIPLGIFGDFPLLHRKKVTSISFSCFDTDQDIIEKAVRYWELQCFPGDNYVAYLDDIVANLTYTSYDVCGNMNFQRILQVIPAGSVSVSRSYEENAAKMVNFSVVAVGAYSSDGAGGEHNKVYYKGKTPSQINEWKNRESGRPATGSGQWSSKYAGIEDGYGNGAVRGYVDYNVFNAVGGVEYGPGQIRASLSRDEG